MDKLQAVYNFLYLISVNLTYDSLDSNNTKDYILEKAESLFDFSKMDLSNQEVDVEVYEKLKSYCQKWHDDIDILVTNQKLVFIYNLLMVFNYKSIFPLYNFLKEYYEYINIGNSISYHRILLDTMEHSFENVDDYTLTKRHLNIDNL